MPEFNSAIEGINLAMNQPTPEEMAWLNKIRAEVDSISDKLKQDTPIFDELAKEVHTTADEKGFWGQPVQMDQWAGKLALIHSEVTEVLEALRKSQGPDKVTEEFADIFIRCLDLYGVLVEHGEADPDLYQVMLDKMKANAERPPKHGNRWG